MQRPLPLHHREHEKYNKNGKDASMNATREAHIEVISQKLILVKGDVAENDPRDSIKKRSQAQEAKRVLKHLMKAVFE